MFSEGLDGFAAIPESRPFFHDSFPGEAILGPIQESLFWLAVGPIPLAFWNEKPIDAAWAWRAQGSRPGADDYQGTTISDGEVGYWYFRYGIWGVIEGGMIFGWLAAHRRKSIAIGSGPAILNPPLIGFPHLYVSNVSRFRIFTIFIPFSSVESPSSLMIKVQRAIFPSQEADSERPMTQLVPSLGNPEPFRHVAPRGRTGWIHCVS